MLIPCQCSLPADALDLPHDFLHGNLLMSKYLLLSVPGISPLSIIQGLLFFALFYTCKVDTYYQKTKTMLYEKM